MERLSLIVNVASRMIASRGDRFANENRQSSILARRQILGDGH
jgi:hypothetical protein